MLPADKEFFASYEFPIMDAPTKREREEIQNRLFAHPEIKAAHEQYIAEFRHAERILNVLYSYQVVEIDGEKTIGKQDLFRVFMERNPQLLRRDGRTGVLVPSAFHANEGATGVRRLYLEKLGLRTCYSFENHRKIFDIHSSFKFATVVAEAGATTDTVSCAFYLHDDEWLFGERDGRQPLDYSLDFIRRTSGEYLSLLELRSVKDLKIAEVCFAKGEPFGRICERLGIRLGRELNMTDDAWRFTPKDRATSNGEDSRDPEVANRLLNLGYSALHEGKTFHQYTDHWQERPRYLVSLDRLMDKPDWRSASRFFRLAFRDVARSTDERTAIFALIPPPNFFGNTAPCEREPSCRCSANALRLAAMVNTYGFDWPLRQKSAAHVNLFILHGCPVPTIDPMSSAGCLLVHSALRLSCNHSAYAPLWREQLGDAWREPRPPFTWPVLATDDERWAVRAAIDAVVADAYGLSRDQYAHVLSTFSHKSYPKAPALCLAKFDELKQAGLEAFTRKYDPYWEIPLNESLPQPVIELPSVGPEASDRFTLGDNEPRTKRRGRAKRPAN
jgi:hypothetical protein